MERLGKLTSRLAISTGTAFVTGAAVGAAVLHALRPPPPPPREVAPIVAVAPTATDEYIPASLPTSLALAASATPSTTPAGAGHRVAAPTDMEQAERQCLTTARLRLGPPDADPEAALRMLGRCEERYPKSLFLEVREQIRREAREAIGRSSPQR